MLLSTLLALALSSAPASPPAPLPVAPAGRRAQAAQAEASDRTFGEGLPRPEGDPRDFAERFALAVDREALLEELIPGTDAHYFHAALVLEQAGRPRELEALLAAWERDLGRTDWQRMLTRRHVLLGYGEDPGGTFAELRELLDLSFEQRRVDPGAKLDLPTRLDPAQLSEATLRERALRLHPRSLDGFTDAALPDLIGTDLTERQLGQLLDRLDVATLPGVVELVLRDLEAREQNDLGSRPLHHLLTLDQLEALVSARPALLGGEQAVAMFLSRLAPSADVDLEHDPEARLAHLERLVAFTERLGPAFRSLRAHVLYHRLAEDLTRGTLDREHLLAYLRTPRPQAYVGPRVAREAKGRQVADLGVGFATGFPPVRDDEAVVRAALLHFLAGDPDPSAFEGLIEADYLRRLFAEAKLLAGVGERSRWYTLLDSEAAFEALEARVELAFAPTQRRTFGAGEPVSLELDVKNVDRLLVKVFEIDTFHYYRVRGKEVDTSIELDGLVSNLERSLTYDAPPIRRVRRVLDLPELSRPGVYVVELVGGGVVSRAVVRKGALRWVERAGAAGHAFRVFDEAGRPLEEATIWFGGKEYRPTEGGEIVLPFSTDPATRGFLVQYGERAALGRFEHRAEVYDLDAEVHVERETLLAGEIAPIVVRPVLRLDGQQVHVGLLEAPVLTVRSLDGQGVASTRTFEDLEPTDDGELSVEVRVPPDLVELAVTLQGRVRPLTKDEPEPLSSATRSFHVNRIDATEATDCPLLSRTPAGWVLDVLGKDGEPRGGRAAELRLGLRDYTDDLRVTLQTDARGRVLLGELPGVTTVHADGFPIAVVPWDVLEHRVTLPRAIAGVTGEVLSVPRPGPLAARATPLSRSEVSLVEERGGVSYRDAFEHLAPARGFLELRGLTPGDYTLRLTDGHGPGRPASIAVRITAGERRAGWAQGRSRWLPLEGRRSLQITGLVAEGDELVVGLANADDGARVVVAAARYAPAYGLFDDLARGASSWTPPFQLEPPTSDFEAGLALADEVRYVLERRFQPQYPGNMLDRPGLLLNPWALQDLNTVLGLGGGAGGRFGGRMGADGRLRETGGAGPGRASSAIDPGTVPNLDFLSGTAVLLANLRPDADGLVRIPLARLGDKQHVRVLALDRDDAVQRAWVRPEVPLEPSTTALTEPLAAGEGVAERRRIQFVAAGETARFEELPGAEVELYDSLEAVFRLFHAVGGDGDLERFSFLLDWPTLSDAEQAAKYAEFACHELHLFLRFKDRPFFERVVRPYLAQKLEREFVDDWLLDEDLLPYLESWRYARLNAVERALLARRLDGEAIRRQLGDLAALRREDAGAERARFGAMLGAGGLERDGLPGFFLGRGMRAAESLRRATEGAPPAAPGFASDEDENGLRALGYVAEAKEGEEEVLDEPALADREDLGLSFERRDLQLDAAQREQSKVLYRSLGATQRLVESLYWHRPIEESVYGLVPVDPFWLDFARHAGEGPFVSRHLVECTDSLNEMLLALAVLDLPFRAPEHELTREEGVTTLKAAGPLLVLLRELGPAPVAQEAAPVLVSQVTYPLARPKRVVDGREVDAIITDEYVVGVPYGCRVVVTNPTSQARDLEVLLQIPAGAIPVRGGVETRGVGRSLEPYGTTTIEYAFYFPRPGTATHYPALVTEAEERVAVAETRVLPVVAEPTVLDEGSWQHVSQNGSLEDVLAFLTRENPQALDLSMLAWRMRERDAFDAILERLRTRRAFAPVLWSYGLFHGDEEVAREYLQQAEAFLGSCGPVLASPLLTIDPFERRTFQRMEFDPLALARAHEFGGRREVPNLAVEARYRGLLELLAFQPTLGNDDWLELTVAFLLQNRIEPALRAFSQTLPTGPEGPEARLQWEYMRCYMAFFGGRDAAEAVRPLAAARAEHPVERWRKRFTNVLAQLDEAAGDVPGLIDPDDREQRQGALAAGEPSLQLTVEGERITLQHANLEACELRFYPMDVELLFSSHPFGDQALSAFGFVRPTEVLPVDLSDAREGARVLDLPAAFRRANVVVEARGAGVVRRTASYASTLSVRTMESYGQLQVRDEADGAPLAGVYVKVFARLADGTERFHKDGYTDLRGRFDYVSLSGDQGDKQRFAILVLDDERGAEVREVAPPVQ